MKSDYYVYTLCDPRKPGAYEYGEYKFEYEPFYVGKGKSNRCTAHLKESSLKVKSYKNNKIKTILNENLEILYGVVGFSFSSSDITFIFVPYSDALPIPIKCILLRLHNVFKSA